MESKLCECGCGQKTNIATRTNIKFGHTKGQPMRYLLGHVQKRWSDKTPEQRFWERVIKTDDCWLWTGAKTAYGYGYIRRSKSNVTAHRYAYELTYGPLPRGIHLLHECDNPPCIRPDPQHVHPGTHAQNMADMSKRGRAEYGERHHNAKLTESDVKIIRAAYVGGISQSELARKFGIHSSAIHAIIHRKLWKHIP